LVDLEQRFCVALFLATHIKWDKKLNTAGCHFERGEKALESAVGGFKGFLAPLEMTGFALVANILKMSASNFMWVAVFLIAKRQ